MTRPYRPLAELVRMLEPGDVVALVDYKTSTAAHTTAVRLRKKFEENLFEVKPNGDRHAVWVTVHG